VARLLGFCGLICLLALAPTAAAKPRVVGAIPFPGGEPLGLALHPATNKLFVTEDNRRSLYVFDALTRRQLAQVAVGGAAFEIEVNHAFGKVYVASEGGCCTTGITSGTGRISVVDARTHALLATIAPPPEGDASEFALANDEAHGRVYVAWEQGIGVIDAATDQFTVLQDRLFEGALGADRWAVNSRTNTAYIPFYARNQLLAVDGATNRIDSISLAGTGGRGPLDIEVNQRENKLYLAMLHQPRKASPAILILDRDTGRTKFVGNDDLQPLAFNERSNRLFSGVQVGERGAVVSGASDRFRPVNLRGDAIGAGLVRAPTDNAYFASDTATYVVNGSTRCVTKLRTGKDSGGGLVQSDIAINQSTGRVYVTNWQGARRVTVLRDGRVPCRRRKR
jgi:DNA-binding beta-propeller fold protein YncE